MALAGGFTPDPEGRPEDGDAGEVLAGGALLVTSSRICMAGVGASSVCQSFLKQAEQSARTALVMMCSGVWYLRCWKWGSLLVCLTTRAQTNKIWLIAKKYPAKSGSKRL